MQGYNNNNTINRAKQAIDRMFSDSQKQEILNALNNVDQNRLRALANQVNLNSLTDEQVNRMLRNVDKEELIRKIKGV